MLPLAGRRKAPWGVASRFALLASVSVNGCTEYGRPELAKATLATPNGSAANAEPGLQPSSDPTATASRAPGAPATLVGAAPNEGPIAATGGSASEAGCGSNLCVDTTSKLQTIDGFGAAIAYDVPFVATNASAQFLFSTEDRVSLAGGTYPGIGLTLIRVGILPDGEVPSFTWPSVKRALAVNPNILVWGAPWTPAAAFKTTGSLTSGRLSHASYIAWANVLANKFVDGAKSAGIAIYGVSAQNEPDFDTSGRWNMCLYSPTEMASFVQALGPKLHALKPPVKLIAAESECWSCASSYFSAIEQDPASLAQVDIFAAHDYQYSAPALTIRPAGKRLWETEVSFAGQPFDASMTMGLWGAKRIHDNLANAGVNAFHWWWFDNAGETQGLLGGDGAPPKLAFAFGNYSRFIRPGFVRVNVSGAIPSGVYVTAYVGSSQQVVLVVINENRVEVKMTARFNGRTPKRLTPWVTSDSDSLGVHAAVPVVTGECGLSLAARSVTTLISD